MISVPAAVTNKLNQSTNIEIGVGATLDINCNTLLSFDEDDFTGVNDYINEDNVQPFKLLFPIDSVVRPFRPERCGIKYAIHNDMIIGEYNNPRATSYATKLGVTHRIYMPTKNLFYKYYVGKANQNADITIRYFNTAAPTISSSNKSVPANKIVLKFELSHCTPSSWSIFINGTDVTSSLSKTIPSNGVVEIYYNGTSWSRDESVLNYNAQVTINTLRVTATNPGQFSYPNPAPNGAYKDYPNPILVNRHIGIIEVAPHWVKDLSDRIVSLGINKEASSRSDDILPVGSATANSLEMELNSYGNANILFRTYNIEESVAINNSYIYMVKQSEIKPYYKIYDSAGTLTDSKGKYFKINQGSFYLDSWKISEHGELNMFSLDGAKFLQETVCPDIICDDYSATAVIRRILDSVGFTNYNINLSDNDRSVLGLRWWWSNGTKTVWSAIQEICNDTQMSAVFDENNILQFYSRDFVFKKKAENSVPVDWTFRDEASGSNLPNIISLDMNTLPASNNVKILYNNAFVAGYEQNNKSLADIDKTTFTSAALMQPLLSTAGAGSYIELDPITIRPAEVKIKEALQSYSGYLLINAEVIEYDAIEYQYDKLDGTGKATVNIESPADLAKYRGLANILNTLVPFAPTGRYRIKKRGAFGTIPANHAKSPEGRPSGWNEYKDGTARAGIVSSTDSQSGSNPSQNDYNEFSYLLRTGVGRSITAR